MRRLQLEPGETMPWHRDPFHRVTVVLCGDALAIEYRDSGESQRLDVTPGQVNWDEPTDRVHRAVNVGGQPYEEIDGQVKPLSRTMAMPDRDCASAAVGKAR